METSTRGRTLRTAAAAYGGASIIVQLLWLVAGDLWWLQPVNLTTFWWTLPAVPLLLGAGVRRRWDLLAALAAPALIFVVGYGALFLPSGAADGRSDLRVATLNTWVHAPGTGTVEALVDEAAPDVLLLQEVFPERLDALGHVLGERFPHRWAADGSAAVGGVAVLSRFPIVDVRDVDPGGRTRPTAVVTLDIDGRAVQVVSLHLVSPCPDCGGSLSERLTFEASTRRAEIRAVLAVLDPSVPTVVGGDLNSTERSDAYRALAEAGFDDTHRLVGSGPGFTWPARRFGPLLRIDWLLSRGLTPVREWVGPAVGSDHRPVIADLSLAT